MSLIATAWKVIQILFAVYQVVSKRASEDPKFKADLEAAAGLAKSARTEKELSDAAKAFQDSLFR